MNISDRINYFTDNLNLKFIKVNYVKLSILEQDIRRYVKRAIKDNCLPELNAQDLRRLCIKLAKIHKTINKKIEFVSLKERINKTGISKNSLSDELNEIIEHIKIAEYVQRVYSLLNFLEMNLDMLEVKLKNEKIVSDEKFNDEIIDTIKVFLTNV